VDRLEEGPYADGFGEEQHKFGPFGAIRVKVHDLGAEFRVDNPPSAA
jgi:hypothetical protein